MVTRYVHVADWHTDTCPNTDGKVLRHHNAPVPDGGYLPGDRAEFMTCQRCGAILWGFCVVTEEDDLEDLL